MNPPESSAANSATSSAAARAIRVWPYVLIMAAYWLVVLVVGRNADTIQSSFLPVAFGGLALLVFFPILWLTNGTIAMRERLEVFAVAVGCALVAILLSLETMGPVGALLYAVPIMFSVWTLWLLVGRKWSPQSRLLTFVPLMILVWLPVVLLRMEGLTGDLNAQLKWRWVPTAEEQMLAKRAESGKRAAEPLLAASPVVYQPGDWPELRGPNRRGDVQGVRIATDWKAHPPKLRWKNDVGPAWSSMVIIGDRLFTQEQRGPKEAVVCLDVDTGEEIWAHEDEARYFDTQAGAGPRSTPTFVDGKIYTMGATGILNCLDAATGKLEWTRDVRVDAGADQLMWGYSCSPLVLDGTVIAYAAGKEAKGLLAFRASDGEPVWNVATGLMSYSSPQGIDIDGQPQVAFLSDSGLISLRPSDGSVLWRYDTPSSSWRALQPRLLGDFDLLVGSEDLGLVRLKVARQGDDWTCKQQFASKSMKPGYNDFQVFGDHAYGFDNNIFCAVELETGKRAWKAGRYGHGQVIALVEQQLLLVLTEEGDVVLVAADPKEHRELGRIKAIEGKTWNHPAIAHGRLYVRNDEQMACFDLTLEDGEPNNSAAER